MILPFVKYQGTGNDFIIVDDRQNKFSDLPVATLCHPKFGIGADGLILLRDSATYDFEMVYYNSDGNLSSMCGNGGRCVVDFAHSLDLLNKNLALFVAPDGPHQALWEKEKVSLQMADVSDYQPIEDSKEAFGVESNACYFIDSGSPHLVLFRDDVDDIDIVRTARPLRQHSAFAPGGTNVNFVEVRGDRRIKVRTYERGVENETLSCGTGVTACAMAYILKEKGDGFNDEVYIETPGGELCVRFLYTSSIFSAVWLIGPAKEVFRGEIEV